MSFHWNQKALSDLIKAEVRKTAKLSCGPFFRRIWYPLSCLAWKCHVVAFAVAGKTRCLRPLQSWIVPDWWSFYSDHPMQGLLFLTAVRLLSQEAEAKRKV